MAEDHNGDVDRAMAAFAASPMPYRSFSTAPAAPGSTANLPDGEVASSHPIRAERVLAFPLLIAALPRINQSPTVLAPVTTNTTLDKTPVSKAEAKKAKLVAEAAKPSDRHVVQQPQMIPSPEQIRPVPHLSATFGLPLRHAPIPLVPRPLAPVTRGANTRTTPIAVIFNALHAASPSQGETPETKAKLQDIFNCL